LFFTGEISYLCFTGSQKYFRGPVKSPYEFCPAIYIWHIFHRLSQRQGRGGALQAVQIPSLPLTREISYRCFKGCFKYFWHPLKFPYEISRVKLHLVVYLSPPDAHWSASACVVQAYEKPATTTAALEWYIK
jgi:hypothetical protein